MQGKEREGPVYFPKLYDHQKLRGFLAHPPEDYQLRMLILSLVSRQTYFNNPDFFVSFRDCHKLARGGDYPHVFVDQTADVFERAGIAFRQIESEENSRPPFIKLPRNNRSSDRVNIILKDDLEAAVLAIGKYYQDARQKVLKYFKERLGTIPPEPGQRQEILDEIPAWVINELHHHFVSVTELLRLSNRKMERRKVRGMADELKEKGIPVA